MDSLLGSWKLEVARNEGPVIEVVKAMDIPSEFVDMYAKATYTLTVEKEGDKYKYSVAMEGAPQAHVAGPFKLGQMFEFYDPFCKRTEQITITQQGARTKEVSVVKENPNLTWTIYRYIEDGHMISDVEAGGKKMKNYFKKV